LIALAVTYRFFDRPINVPPAGPWWLYLGGPLGVAFISIAAWAVKPLGLLLFTLLTLAGQLAGALLLDVFFPAPGTIVSWQLLAGVALTLVAAGLASIRR
jgi:transporter family-2 protein